MEIELKKAQTSDIEKLREFAEWTFRMAYEHLNTPEPFENYCQKAFEPTHFSSLFDDQNAEFWIAFSPEADILGYLKVNLGRSNDAQNPPKNLDGRQSELERIYVHPEKKGLGLGKILIEKAVDLAKTDGSKWLWLGVWKRNPAAISFYEKHGFAAFGEHIFHMGEEAQMDLVMSKLVD